MKPGVDSLGPWVISSEFIFATACLQPFPLKNKWFIKSLISTIPLRQHCPLAAKVPRCL